MAPTRQIHTSSSTYLNLTNKIYAKRKHNYTSLPFWLAIVTILFEAIYFTLSILTVTLKTYDEVNLFSAQGYKIWFNWLTYFTFQTNFLVFVFLLIFLINVKSKIFNNRYFANTTCFYIDVTALIFAIWFFWWIFNGAPTKDFLWLPVFRSLIAHLICPVLFNLFYFYSVNYPYKAKELRNPMQTVNWKKLWYWLIIYLLVYGTYLISINFIKMPVGAFRSDLQELVKDHPYVSIYGYVTNFNPHCLNTMHQGATLTLNPNSQGDPVKVGLIFPFLLVVIAIYFLIIWGNNKLATPQFLSKEIRQKKIHMKEWKASIVDKYPQIFYEEYQKYCECQKDKKSKHKSK